MLPQLRGWKREMAADGLLPQMKSLQHADCPSPQITSCPPPSLQAALQRQIAMLEDQIREVSASVDVARAERTKLQVWDADWMRCGWRC